MKKVFIIHGWTYSLDKWSVFCAELRKHNIEPVQLRVPGLTDDSDKVWDIDGYIEWLNKQLSGQKSPTVIGHSNGGRIALSFAQKYPNRIGQLILIDSAGIAHTERRSLLKLKTLKFLSKIGKLFSYIPPLKKVFYKLIGAKDYYNAPPNMKRTMQNMLQADQLLDLSLINLPVTIIWGREDTITPLKEAQLMHKSIASSDLYIIDDARHSPFFSHPEKTASIVVKVLGR